MYSYIDQLASLSFTGGAHNAVLIGGPDTGKTHLATALGVSGIRHYGKWVRFYSTVDLVNALEQEKASGKAGRLALSLVRMDLLILDELRSLSSSQAGGALLDRLTHHCHIVETGNKSFRFRRSAGKAKGRATTHEQSKRNARASPSEAAH